jgi:outer membrane protein OmpA-like peptidoglycan-associated protein
LKLSTKALLLITSCLLVTALSLYLNVPGLNAGGAAQAQEVDAKPEAVVEELMQQAKKMGAKGQLPHAWWKLDSRVGEAKKNGAGPEEWAAMEVSARRLVNAAAFVEEMRSQKSGMEALLGRFDQALMEIGTLYSTPVDPELSGSDLARDLIYQLNAKNLERQVLIDSLTVVNRHYSEMVDGRTAAQDSLITALQVEVGSLRRQLWETELRVGVAEADRSAAENVLTKKQDREAAIAAVRASFTPEEGEIILMPGGEVVIRVHGIAFGVGSATLNSGQDLLVDKIVAAISLFPGSLVRVEGHTDNTGSADANLRLSRRRAETVAGLLEPKLGLQEGTIGTEGFGPDKPVALNSTPEGRALNRRIDVVIGAVQ